MKYYVIADGSNVIAIVFHSYRDASFLIKTVSESFRRSFEAFVLHHSKVNFVHQNNRLKVNTFGPQYVSWSKKVLESICSDFWRIKDTGELTGEAFIEDIVSKFLKNSI